MPFTHPDWPAPKRIRALSTRRHPGVSLSPYDSNNLGLHVHDDPEHVMANRKALVQSLQLPAEPQWLGQTHTSQCVIVEQDSNRQADAAITRSSAHVLAIMTADCLPVLLCNRQGNEIAAIHAGWRGLVNGIIENTVQTLNSHPHDMMAWIGPAICGSCYEVGDDVREAYLGTYPFSNTFFTPRNNKWLIDLPGIAEYVLNNLGITAVYSSRECTFEKKTDYYSYRREAQTGRIATLIWFNKTNQDIIYA